MADAPTVHDVQMVKLSGLQPHPENYHRHPEEQKRELAQALREQGWTRNIVVTRFKRKTTILAGHGMVEVGIEQGMEEAPAVVLKIDPNSRAALKILVGDNELAWLAESDTVQLARLGRILADSEDLFGSGLTEPRLLELEESEAHVQDASGEWTGMPEFDNENVGVHKVTVHFKDWEAYKQFCELIGQQLSDTAKACWFPEEKWDRVKDSAWEPEEGEADGEE